MALGGISGKRPITTWTTPIFGKIQQQAQLLFHTWRSAQGTGIAVVRVIVTAEGLHRGMS